MTNAVSVLGLGPMGQALSGALLDKGHRVTVWNRTASKAEALRARGAVVAPDPAAAVAASDLTLINVVDHDAVDSILAMTGDAADGRVIVGLSSDTPDRARQTAKLVAHRGGRYLDGAIMTPTSTIGTPEASILFAGPREIFDAHRDVFATLGVPTWLDEDTGRAAAFDMSLLDLFWTSVSGFMHAMEVAKANGIGPSELLPHALGIVGILSPILEEFVERVENNRHGDSSAPVSSVAVSVRHLIAASHDAGVDAGMLEVFRGYVDVAVADGHGAEEVSSIATAMADRR
ncbi:NAD(P)-dependent oxidoreductase [Mycobacterium deserti]|uniref:NAD(P)-binding domain-containing protein n=1 Tax=Mycobacterium deserti TaxID=2978347 RepID=A0ABT2MH63_9MYCO|nr:NAD(P)-binding domain-containing protein [Mycobacterium deserti]MCT7661625.1 NAD(P)-binding domain-containing protein [Mycobacterium deserti]